MAASEAEPFKHRLCYRHGAQADRFAQALDAKRKKQAALVKAKAVALAEADA